jgi:hypothetical protein
VTTSRKYEQRDIPLRVEVEGGAAAFYLMPWWKTMDDSRHGRERSKHPKPSQPSYYEQPQLSNALHRVYMLSHESLDDGNHHCLTRHGWGLLVDDD